MGRRLPDQLHHDFEPDGQLHIVFDGYRRELAFAAAGLDYDSAGETIWSITGRAWKYRPTDDPDFLFGARQNQVYNNNTNDAFIMNLAINLYSMSPRMSGQGYGFNG